jgi:ATP-dependent Lon protease
MDTHRGCAAEGGIKEKVWTAKRAGVHDAILPAENRTNVEEDLTPEQLQGLTTHYVKTIDEVLEFAAGQFAARLDAAPLCSGGAAHP